MAATPEPLGLVMASPQPTKYLFISSLVNILGALFLTSCSLASIIAAPWDACAVIAAGLLIPVSVGIGISQYRGVFHRNQTSADTTGVTLSVIGALLLFGGVTYLKESFDDPSILHAWMMMVCMAALGLYFALCGWANLAWSRLLKTAADSPEKSPKPETVSRWDRTAALLATTFIVIATSLMVSTIPPEFAENVEYARPPFGIPVGATSISFCQGSRGTIAYEFSIDESGFREWLQKTIDSMGPMYSRNSIEPITTTFTMKRYVSLKRELKGDPNISISDGLRYSWHKEDRGKYAAFDRTTNRAYYYSHDY